MQELIKFRLELREIIGDQKDKLILESTNEFFNGINSFTNNKDEANAILSKITEVEKEKALNKVNNVKEIYNDSINKQDELIKNQKKIRMKILEKKKEIENKEKELSNLEDLNNNNNPAGFETGGVENEEEKKKENEEREKREEEQKIKELDEKKNMMNNSIKIANDELRIMQKNNESIDIAIDQNEKTIEKLLLKINEIHKSMEEKVTQKEQIIKFFSESKYSNEKLKRLRDYFVYLQKVNLHYFF